MSKTTGLRLLAMLLLGGLVHGPAVAAVGVRPAPSLVYQTIEAVQPKVVKLYGAGGFQQLKAYQTGLVISPEGHILTVFSHVLDTDALSVTLADGRKFPAKLLGADPRLEIAVLKIEARGLPAFELAQAVPAQSGQRMLALSNLFGVASGNEPVSVQQCVVAVKAPLQARRGVFETPYHGPVYVLDAVTNNPGAAGGALVTQEGELVGLLGKELRNAVNETWLSYAIPIEELRSSVDRIRSGGAVAAETPAEKKPRHPLSLEQLGLVLIPDVVDRTPPYIDEVRPDSPAAEADVRPDDIVVMLNQQLVRSRTALDEELAKIERATPVRVTLLRGQQMLEVELKATDP